MATPYGYQRFVIATDRTKHCSELSELKSWLRIDTSDEDTEIDYMGFACQKILEDLTNTTIMQQTMTAYFDGFPPEGTPIELPRPPLISITHIKYVDEDGTMQTWSDSLWTVSALGKMPATILPIAASNYPSTGDVPTTAGIAQSRYQKVQIEYEAGYAAAASVPDGLVVGHRMFVGHFYENREATTTVRVHDLPLGLQMIVAANKVPEVN